MQAAAELAQAAPGLGKGGALRGELPTDVIRPDTVFLGSDVFWGPIETSIGPIVISIGARHLGA